jgi:tRNA modification GTPase
MIDRALCTRFVAPASFTGEDSVEFGCHGGELTPRLLLEALRSLGARDAQPGEFTRRAYLNGRVDLVQAEAIGDLINSRSPAMRRAAIHQVERGLSGRLGELRDAVLRAEALSAYSIDFPEEDEPPVPMARIVEAVEDARDRINRMLRTAPEGRLLRHGPLVVLAGRPNSGKSSLFNALLGFERSIVTDIPGTTRDAVEAEVVLGGYPFRLADTAGIRETADKVEAVGIEVARRYVGGADILLFCTDSIHGPDPLERQFLEEYEGKRVIIVRTKMDLTLNSRTRSDGVFPESATTICLSVITGEGLGELCDCMAAMTFRAVDQSADSDPVITRERHARALGEAAAELELFLLGSRAALPLDLAATHLRAAVAAIDGIIGIVTPDDILGAVFSTFCVGK